MSSFFKISEQNSRVLLNLTFLKVTFKRDWRIKFSLIIEKVKDSFYDLNVPEK